MCSFGLQAHIMSLYQDTHGKPLVLQSHPNLAAFSNWQGIRETLFQQDKITVSLCVTGDFHLNHN